MKLATFLLGLLSLGAVTALPPQKQVLAGRNEAFDDCGQNEEDGLGPSFQGMLDLIPIGEVLTILAEYLSEDEEVQNAFDFLESDDMATIVNTISSTSEFIEILEYFCYDLKLNLYYYFNLMGDLLGFPLVTRPSGPRPKFNREPGIRGLINEVGAVLPRKEISDVWWDNRENNVYLQRAIAKLQSDTFKALADQVQALKEFQYLLQRLTAVGFDMEYAIEAILRWLGWSE